MPTHGAPNPFQTQIRQVIAFFRRKGWREVLTFMFCVVCSLGLWYLQALQDDYEIEITIPVKYRNVPNNMAIIANNPQEIVAKVRDKGTLLINYLWMGSFSPLEIDVSKLPHEADSKDLSVSRRMIETGIMKHLAASTQLINFEPSTIRVVCVEQGSREVPVEVDLKLETATGFQLSDRITITPAKVRVYADRTRLDSISSVRTIPIRLTGISHTKTLTARLAEIPGMRFDPQTVRITVPVEEFTEKRLTLPIRCDSVPEGYALRMFPNTVEAICNVPLSHFKELSDGDLEILIPFREFESRHAEGKITLRLTKKPDWLTDYDLNPDAIEFILEEQ